MFGKSIGILKCEYSQGKGTPTDFKICYLNSWIYSQYHAMFICTGVGKVNFANTWRSWFGVYFNYRRSLTLVAFADCQQFLDIDGLWIKLVKWVFSQGVPGVCHSAEHSATRSSWPSSFAHCRWVSASIVHFNYNSEQIFFVSDQIFASYYILPFTIVLNWNKLTWGPDFPW